MTLSPWLRFPWMRVAFATALICSSMGCTKEKNQDKDEKPDASADQREKGGSSASTKSKADGNAPSAKKAAEVASALPEKEVVEPVINPKKLEPYAGPTGIVRGVVRATGDKAPELPKTVAKMEASCDRSRSVFGVLFREGENRELADVLVAVTHYEGFVPAKEDTLKVWGKGCAWDQRTYAMTFGMQLEIDGADNRPYVPELLGQPMPAQLFVLPTAPAVKLPPKKPGRYKLVDSMRLFNAAELFVLPYATTDVTGLDGTFEIQGIPVGEVQINALLPQTGQTAEKKITIEEGKVTEVDFELSFDRSAWDKAPKPTPLDELPAPGDSEP